MSDTVDFKALQAFRDNLAKLTREQTAQFTKAAVKELAARLLRKVKKVTPVGDYPPESGKMGGTLRRNWTVGEIVKTGDTYSIELINPTEYGVYVEFGHRTPNHAGWVPGQFFLTISEAELKRDATRILQQKLTNFVKGALNAK